MLKGFWPISLNVSSNFFDVSSYVFKFPWKGNIYTYTQQYKLYDELYFLAYVKELTCPHESKEFLNVFLLKNPSIN